MLYEVITPKGGVITLRNNEFPNPAGLVAYISKNVATIKIRPDQKIVIIVITSYSIHYTKLYEVLSGPP